MNAPYYMTDRWKEERGKNLHINENRNSKCQLLSKDLSFTEYHEGESMVTSFNLNFLNKTSTNQLHQKLR